MFHSVAWLEKCRLNCLVFSQIESDSRLEHLPLPLGHVFTLAKVFTGSRQRSYISLSD